MFTKKYVLFPLSNEKKIVSNKVYLALKTFTE